MSGNMKLRSLVKCFQLWLIRCTHMHQILSYRTQIIIMAVVFGRALEMSWLFVDCQRISGAGSSDQQPSSQAAAAAAETRHGQQHNARDTGRRGEDACNASARCSRRERQTGRQAAAVLTCHCRYLNAALVRVCSLPPPASE